MPARLDRPFRPILRTLRIAVTVSVVFTVVGSGTGHTLAVSSLVFLALFALASGVGAVLHRADIAEAFRARRENGVS